jgi:hypothetical protein
LELHATASSLWCRIGLLRDAQVEGRRNRKHWGHVDPTSQIDADSCR